MMNYLRCLFYKIETFKLRNYERDRRDEYQVN